ncbi:MAG: hypothetical protein HC780_13970 [Leptolyngbyaceae cyanobacterium CSU_1_3]|nr:hypothetical protein [Leptolyngbyaceae cyanobacterium CSU_1_3]
MNPSPVQYIIQMPAGGEHFYNPTANAAGRPFQPGVAIALIAATVLLAFIALQLPKSRR